VEYRLDRGRVVSLQHYSTGRVFLSGFVFRLALCALQLSICVSRRGSAVKDVLIENFGPVIVRNGDMFLFVVVSRQTKN